MWPVREYWVNACGSLQATGDVKVEIVAARTGASGRGKADGAARANGSRRLVIVESPSKARTIAGYLGDGYVVESSIGHIRDMPDKAAEIPLKYRKEPWARLGVNVDADFEPLYVVNSDKKQQVSKLKTLLKDADELLLATDEDREGEAIAWHLLEELKPRIPAHRMVFHEITPEAIARAVASPREVDLGMVEAYQTRRVLDRLYGYEVSPVLWKKVMPALSAGRVQSVAVRLVVDRERERIAFRPAQYWDLEAEFAKRLAAGAAQADVTSFLATLVTVDGRRVAQGRDFTSVGALKAGDSGTPALQLDGAAAAALKDRLSGADFTVKSVERKPYRRQPYAPFRTTTLQQEASRKLGFSAKYTMQLAQRLYENGHITYMRTDSITLSQTAITAARRQASELYGADYVPDKPRTYASKVKSAQEAHEAIRPAGDSFRTPAQAGLSGDQLRLYELVWKRTVASQMKDATGESVAVRVLGKAGAAEPITIGAAGADGALAAPQVIPGREAEFGASGKIIGFYGFLKAYVEGSDDPDAELDDNQRRLPPLATDDALDALDLEPAEHATRAPARYTEASLIKELEDREIGRPSTYASIIGTILDRGYVFKKGTALVPSFVAFAVVTLLERHFTQLVDYDFTARMEDALDDIAKGEAERVPWLRRFYFGADGEEGLKELVSDLGEIDARDVSSFPLNGTDIVVRVGRYGPYLERDGQRVNVPEGTAPGRADPGAGRRAAVPAERREDPGHRPVERQDDRGQGGPLRPVRDRAARRGRDGQAEVGVAAQVDGPGQHHAGRRAAPADPATRAGPARRRGRYRAERAVRALCEARYGQPLTGIRRADVHGHARRGDGAVRAAEDARPRGPRGHAAAAGAGRRLRERQADRAQGGPVRPVRDRRRDQRLAAQGRHGRGHHHAAGDRAAGRAPGRRPGAQAPPRRAGEGQRDQVGGLEDGEAQGQAGAQAR